MATVQVAELRGQPPSELLGVTCAFCAYCLDEAFVIRRAVLQRPSPEEKQDERVDFHRKRLGLVK